MIEDFKNLATKDDIESMKYELKAFIFMAFFWSNAFLICFIMLILSIRG